MMLVWQINAAAKSDALRATSAAAATVAASAAAATRAAVVVVAAAAASLKRLIEILQLFIEQLPFG